MSIRINGLQLSVNRVISPGHDRAERIQPRRDKSRNPEAARKRVANLLQIGRKLTEKSAKPWELVARTAEGVCGRIDQHKGVIVRRFLLMQAARNGWDYTQGHWHCTGQHDFRDSASRGDCRVSTEDTEIFEQAFGCGMSSQIGTCDCGRVFWDGHNSGYDWHDGQQDELIADKNATRVGWGVEYVDIFGAMYCQDCDCWKDKAQRIIDWLRENQSQIGEFFRLEKNRLEEAAKSVPVIGAAK